MTIKKIDILPENGDDEIEKITSGMVEVQTLYEVRGVFIGGHPELGHTITINRTSDQLFRSPMRLDF